MPPLSGSTSACSIARRSAWFSPESARLPVLARDPRSDRRGAVLFLGGLVLVMAAVAVVGRLGFRATEPSLPREATGASPGALVLGPRDPNEPAASAVFTLQGRRSGSEGSFYLLGSVKNTSPFAIDKPEV